jgi:hypothetical protein
MLAGLIQRVEAEAAGLADGQPVGRSLAASLLAGMRGDGHEVSAALSVIMGACIERDAAPDGPWDRAEQALEEMGGLEMTGELDADAAENPWQGKRPAPGATPSATSSPTLPRPLHFPPQPDLDLPLQIVPTSLIEGDAWLSVSCNRWRARQAARPSMAVSQVARPGGR